jgi:hypothetical protein
MLIAGPVCVNVKELAQLKLQTANRKANTRFSRELARRTDCDADIADYVANNAAVNRPIELLRPLYGGQCNLFIDAA